MKTVQEHLKSVNREELIDTYLYKYPVNLHNLTKKYDKMTVAEAKEQIRKKMSEFVDHLSNLEVKEPNDDKTYFLMAHARLSDCSVQKMETSLFCLEEVLQCECPNAYGYALMIQAEVMGYYIADNDYTQRNILEVLADMLYEVSFFGVKQETLEDLARELEESRQQYEAGEAITFEEFIVKLGVLKDELTWDRSRLENEAMEGAYKANRAYIDQELEQVRKKYKH